MSRKRTRSQAGLTGLTGLTGLAMMAVGLLAGGTVAQAATTEVRVVGALANYGTDGELIDPDTGWVSQVSGSGSVEIGSAYGAPQGPGRKALMLDTPGADDSVEVYARTEQFDQAGAFPDVLRVAPDQRLGFWLYRSGASTSAAGPVLRAYVGNVSMTPSAWITFDPVANGRDDQDTWIYVDATDGEAMWTVTVRDYLLQRDVSRSMSWLEVSEFLKIDLNGEVNWATFQYGLSFVQNTPGTFSAIDGVTASTPEWSSVTDFELGHTSGQPVLDSCKNGGWQTNYATNSYKNQGACIAAIVAQS